MKKLVFLVMLAVAVSSCTKKTIVLKAPPGQVKKVTGNQSANSNAPGQQKKAAGTQSAKSFAPGQQKKNTSSPSINPKNSNSSKKKE